MASYSHEMRIRDLEQEYPDIERLIKSLRRCLTEAEGFLDEARGCKPNEMIGYDGWADEARKLLEESDNVVGQGTAHDGN